MSNLKKRITDLEDRGKPPTGDLVVWVVNPLDGSDPEPRPVVKPGDLFFEVVYVNPPVYPDVAA